MSERYRTHLICAVATCLLSAAPEAARAAIASCLAPLSGKPAQARGETEARRQALADWTDRARQIGPEYTRWQLAFDRSIDCSRTADGGFLCQAVGRPCTIKQVPPEPGTFKVLPREP